MRRGLKRPSEADVASDAGSVKSRSVRLPLPDNVDETPDHEINFFGNCDSPIEIDDNLSIAPDPPECPERDVHDERPIHEESASAIPSSLLSEADNKNLQAMVTHACLSTKPAFKFQMPWERKGLSLIFNRDRKKLVPMPVMSPIDVDSISKSASSTRLQAHGRVVRGIFSEVINFGRTDASEKDLEDSAMRKSLEKWYRIFATGREAWPRGFDLSEAIRNHQLDEMKWVFGNRSAGTILRRGTSMLQFIKWYRTRFFALCPFPITADAVEDYVQAMIDEGKPASNLRGFVESLNFCRYVVGMELGFETGCVISPKVQRLIEVCDSRRKEKTQARVLTVKEVEFLELCLSNECLDLTDRVACGCMLFCLFSRSRWSDIRKIYGFMSDIVEKDGRISGYLECRTRSHKTARLVAKGGLSKPLVAPVWGVTSPPWGLSFTRVCRLAGRPIESLDQEPLLSAPCTDGSWSARSVTTKEAGKWIRNLLRSMDKDSAFTTIHTLKATALSWCCKFGLDPDTRAILGHHSTGKSSAECYGRDNLAKPLRDLERVLQQIRTKAFSPDATRSGMIGSSLIADPRNSFEMPLDTSESKQRKASEDSSSDSSSSSKDDSDKESSTDADDNFDPVAAPRNWGPDLVMYRNIKSQIVHVVAVGETDSFSCGVRISDDYEKVSESPFLDFRKCKRCAASKPIKTIGQLTAGLRKLRTEK